jgi:hypothetical protein
MIALIGNSTEATNSNSRPAQPPSARDCAMIARLLNNNTLFPLSSGE